MGRSAVQEAHLLDTSSDDARTIRHVPVGSDPVDDNSFFTSENIWMMKSTVEYEVQMYLQNLDQTLAYPVIRALFIKYSTAPPSGAPVKQL